MIKNHLSILSFQAFKQYLGNKSGNSISGEKGGRFGTQLRGRGGTDSTQSSTRRKRSISITKGINIVKKSRNYSY